MNDALITIPAAGGAQAAPRFARLVRHGVVACVLACTAFGALAQGQERSPRRDEAQQQVMRERYEARMQEPRFDPRVYEREDERRREIQVQERRADEGRRSGRLTPDERRDLRRQINEAGADLYPNARRR